MRVPTLTRQPDLLEQLIGKRRARRLRRKAGFLAIGTGLSLVTPTSGLARAGVLLVTGLSAVGLVTVVQVVV